MKQNSERTFKINVWLDDERPMPTGFHVHATSAGQAIALLKAGNVSSISLDHDLGDEQNGTGYDVACFIEQSAFEGTLPPVEVAIHSANPVGRSRMEQAIERAVKYWVGDKNAFP